MPKIGSIPGTIQRLDDVDDSHINGLSGCWLGYEQIVVPQTGITAIANIAGLSRQVDVNANRKLLIIAYLSSWVNPAGPGTGELTIFEGATQLGYKKTHSDATALEGAIAMAVVDVVEGGSHTYKVCFEQTSGTGTATFSAGAGRPSFILVLDIGPAS